MLTESLFFEVARKLCGKDDIDMTTSFLDLDMDSSKVIELLIEYEIMLNVDVLDDRLNLDDMRVLQDVYDYLARIAGV